MSSNSTTYDLIVVGGGAAGFFAALQVLEHRPNTKVLLLEKQKTFLNKVRISGGGRCNVTNSESKLSAFASAYPRGKKAMKHLLDTYSNEDVKAWFKAKGVVLKTEADGRIFPASDSSETIIRCFMESGAALGLECQSGVDVNQMKYEQDVFELSTNAGTYTSNALLLAIGGSLSIHHTESLKALNLSLQAFIPSLFTFKVPEHPLVHLSGISVPNAILKLESRTHREQGSLLITHQGFSGPVVLRLSAFEAVFLNEVNYRHTLAINWTGEEKENAIREVLAELKKIHPSKSAHNVSAWGIPSRLWITLAESAGITERMNLSEIPAKNSNRWVEQLFHYQILISGKSSFKEEFVHAGGIKETEWDPKTGNLFKHPGLFAAGEILPIDGITGGYNFQAAWSSAYIAAKAAVTFLSNQNQKK